MTPYCCPRPRFHSTNFEQDISDHTHLLHMYIMGPGPFPICSDIYRAVCSTSKGAGQLQQHNTCSPLSSLHPLLPDMRDIGCSSEGAANFHSYPEPQVGTRIPLQAVVSMVHCCYPNILRQSP